MLFLENAKVVDPSQNIDEKLNLLIKDGTVSWIGAGRPFSEGEIHVLNLAGKTIVPGLIDAHVHFRDPGLEYKETITTGAEAAVAGGFTSVIAMANTVPTVDTVKTLSYVLEKGSKSACHFASMATVTKGISGQELSPMEDLAKAGAIGFSDDGFAVKDPQMMLQAFEEAARLGMTISVHCEDPALWGDRSLNRGAISRQLDLVGVPAVAEEAIIQRDILLASKAKARVHIQHISSAVGVEMVRRAKADGIAVTAEVTPHHLVLTENTILEQGAMAKMSPPLRTVTDMIALRKGLLDGTIDMVATDHAPHSADEKAKGIASAPNGIVGLETAFPVLYSELVETGYMSLSVLIDRMSFSPARIWNLPGGTLSVGSIADLTVFDCDNSYTINPEEFKSKGRNTPFGGREVKGGTALTIVDGKIAYSSL